MINFVIGMIFVFLGMVSFYLTKLIGNNSLWCSALYTYIGVICLFFALCFFTTGG